MNKGLSELLKKSFLIPVERPKILNGLVPDPHWLAGFTAGDGCYLVNILKQIGQIRRSSSISTKASVNICVIHNFFKVSLII